MNKLTVKLSIGLTLSLSVLLIIWLYPDLSYGLGLLLGGFSSTIAFVILNLQIMSVRVTRLKQALIFNRLIRYLVYILSFIAAYFLPALFSIFTTIIGLFMIKLSLLILNYFKLKESRGKPVK